MKKFLLFFLVLLSFLNLRSQSAFNRANHNQTEIIGPLLSNVNGDFYYSSNAYSFGQFGNCYIYRYNAMGNLKSKIPFQNNFINFALLNGSIKTNDNKLLVIGHTLICDVLDSAYIRTFISKIDTNGNLLFITKIKRQFGPVFSLNTDNFKNVLQNTDSSYCAFTDSVIYKFSKTGQLLFRKNLGTDSITSCLLLQNNNILLSAKHSGNKLLYVISPNGNFVNLYPFPSLLKKMLFYDGQKISGLGLNGLIYKIHPAFSLLGNSPVANAPIKDFICDNDTIYSISNSNYSVMDTAFTVLSVNTNTTQKNNQIAIIKNNNSIAITAASATGGINNGHSFTSLNVMNTTGNNNFYHDIEVADVTPDSVYCILNSFNEFYTYLRAKIKVKNKGATVINEFTLNSDRNIVAICGGLYYQQTFTQTIQPGDSLTVTTSFIHKRYLTMTPTQPTLSVQYCVFSTMPNKGNDNFIGNDELCKNFIFQNPTASVNEFNNKENLFNVYPNPFNDILTVESTFLIKRIDIFNTLGSLLFSETPDKNTLSIIDRLNKPGVYFIKIETDKGTQIKKVVKQ